MSKESSNQFSPKRKARDIMILHEDWFFRGMSRKQVEELEICIEKCLEEAFDAGIIEGNCGGCGAHD